jgi:hypothetical protein
VPVNKIRASCVISGMTRDDEYRKKAAEAQQEADRSTNEVERAAWLRMVRGWLSLIRRRPQSDDTETR